MPPYFVELMQMKAPEITYFNHLYSEYLTYEGEVSGKLTEKAKEEIEAVFKKRDEKRLDWNDIYLFELILADVRPASTLRGKIVGLRHDYRSIAGQVEHDEYMASRPKDLLDPPDPHAPPDTRANYEKLLREDLKDLLGRVYLRYAVLPVREGRLKELTVRAATLCGIFLGILILFMIIVLVAVNVRAGGQWYIPSISLFVVMATGAMGGFVSALQRVQTSPQEGDSIYNLSMLFHGSYAVFVAPLTGAIFAVLLYLMFTGGILQGTFFPNIYTPKGETITLTSEAEPKTTPTATPDTKSNSNTNANSDAALNNNSKTGGNSNATPANNANANAVGNVNAVAVVSNANANAMNINSSNSNATNSNAGNANGGTNVNASNTNANANTKGAVKGKARDEVSQEAVATKSIGIKEFLADSGPAGGMDYALLIIWSFIAGFAERFVPDALNRVVAGRQADSQPRT